MAIIIGITGGSASGKTTLAETLAQRLGGDAALIEQDWYYRGQQDVPEAKRAAQNYDHPGAIETALLVDHIERLREGEAVDAPTYDFERHARGAATRDIGPAPILIVAGLHILGDDALRSRLDLSVYVDVPADLRFIRRLQRDTTERGRTVDSVVRQYIDHVRPMHEQFVEPTKEYADLIVESAEEADWVLDAVLRSAGTAK